MGGLANDPTYGLTAPQYRQPPSRGTVWPFDSYSLGRVLSLICSCCENVFVVGIDNASDVLHSAITDLYCVPVDYFVQW